MSELIYKKEFYEIVGAAMEVHKILGPGFLEPVYQEALAREFALRDISYEREVELDIFYKEYKLDKKYFSDFICYDKIVVELKAESGTTGKDTAQVINCLKATGYDLGILLNFGTKSLFYKRFVLTNQRNQCNSRTVKNGVFEYMKMIKNAVGRMVPDEINGKKVTPFKGIGNHKPAGRKYGPPIPTFLDYPEDGNKCVKSLKDALVKCGLKDGMTISTHHHMRDGDLVSNKIFDIAAELGVKDITWLPSASFPCNAPVIDHLKSGVIHHIEGSMNGALGKFVTQGGMKGAAVLRSHGGRCQAVQDGEVKIDIAVIAAPTADSFGNSNGLHGPSACGGLGYVQADYLYADKVIVVTDNLVQFPCMPMEVEGNYVDYVVQVDKIGIPEKIVSGTTQITKSPDRLLIAELTAKFCEVSGILHDGCCIQAGAGGTSLAIGVYLHEILKERNWKSRFGFGGSTKYMVKMLEEGQMEHILDAQAFDLEAVKSVIENAKHHAISVFNAYNPHSKGNYTTMMDIMILGATEIDVNFNGNVVTHSDGHLLHGIGGWQNCLNAKCVIMPVPSFRDRIPVIVDEVTTLVGPGEMIDVIITERGIAINPKRTDLLEKVKDSGLPIRTIEEIKAEVDDLIGGAPAKPKKTDEVVGVVKWIDGTVIDSIYKVNEQ